MPCYPWLHALLVVCACEEREAHASISVSQRASGRCEKSSEPGSRKGGCGVWEQHVTFIVGTRPGWAHTSQVKSEAGNHSGKNAEKIRGEAQRWCAFVWMREGADMQTTHPPTDSLTHQTVNYSAYPSANQWQAAVPCELLSHLGSLSNQQTCLHEINTGGNWISYLTWLD